MAEREIQKGLDDLLSYLTTKIEDLNKRITNLEGVEGGSGSGGAPSGATYITQLPTPGLSAEQALALLASGILKSTTGTGVVSIATAGVDYADVIHSHTSGQYVTMVGATALADGVKGAVPQPLIANRLQFLRGDGTWADVDASTLTYTPATLADWTGGVDPGDGDQAFDQLASRVTTLEGSSPGSVNSGTATADFGAFVASTNDNLTPTPTTTVTVTGQASLIAGSAIQAWVSSDPAGTADHSVEEHILEDFKCTIGNIIAGTGFDIFVECGGGGAWGQYTINWMWV